MPPLGPQKIRKRSNFKKFKKVDPNYSLNYVKCNYSVLECSFDGSSEIKLLIFSNIALFCPFWGPKNIKTIKN
jgi:hypothetical protein